MILQYFQVSNSLLKAMSTLPTFVLLHIITKLWWGIMTGDKVGWLLVIMKLLISSTTLSQTHTYSCIIMIHICHCCGKGWGGGGGSKGSIPWQCVSCSQLTLSSTAACTPLVCCPWVWKDYAGERSFLWQVSAFVGAHNNISDTILFLQSVRLHRELCYFISHSQLVM